MNRTTDDFGVVTEIRPWGKFHEYRVGLKILEVSPEQELSLQYHHERAEFWEVLEGNPIITVGDKKIEAKRGDRFYVPGETLHRINGGATGTRIFEIATGHFDESDIVRVEDNYGRN